MTRFPSRPDWQKGQIAVAELAGRCQLRIAARADQTNFARSLLNLQVVPRYLALDRIVRRFDPMDRFMLSIAARRWRVGANDDLRVTRTIRLDTRQGSEQPFADSTKRIVRKRIYGGVVSTESVLFRVAVPTFPNRSRPLIDLVAPGRELVALQQERCQIMLAGGGENGKQRTRA